MAITQLTNDLNIHQSLADLPNSADGLSAAQLKVKYDEAVNLIKTYLNTTLIAELESVVDGSSGADKIAATAITNLTGATVQTLLESLRDNLKAVTDGVSGADFVGMTAITETGASATVQSVVEALITRLKATTDSVSGADLIGATTITDLTGNTVQALLESLKTYVNTIDTANKNGDHLGTWQGYTPSQVDQTLRDEVESNTTQLAQKVTFHASKLINKLQTGENGVIVFLGDSTTEQNTTTNGQPNHVGLLTTWLQGLYPGLLTVYNAGISGENISMMLERLYEDVLSKNPDLIIVCSGINDQGGTYNITVDEFKKNYNVLVQEIISQSNIDVVLRTTNVVMSVATSDAINVYNDVTRAIAKKYNLGLYDLFNLMRIDMANGTLDMTVAGVDSPFLNDSVHPNANGHIYIADNFKTYFETKEFIQKPLNIFNMISAKGGFRNVGGTEFAGISYVNGYTLLFNQPTKKISFEYEGEDITIVYGMTTGTGQFIVYIDEVAQTLVDTYSPTTKYRGSVSYVVASGKHLVEIECQSTKNASSSSTNLQIQAIIYKKLGKINMGLIPTPYSYLDIRQTVAIALTDGVESTFIFNSVPFNVGDIASYVLATGEITFKKAGLYQIYFSNRFITDADKSLEVNYKVNATTIKRAYSRTPNSVAQATPSISLDLTDVRAFSVGDILKFSINAQGTAPTDIAYVIINKLG